MMGLSRKRTDGAGDGARIALLGGDPGPPPPGSVSAGDGAEIIPQGGGDAVAEAQVYPHLGATAPGTALGSPPREGIE